MEKLLKLKYASHRQVTLEGPMAVKLPFRKVATGSPTKRRKSLSQFRPVTLEPSPYSDCIVLTRMPSLSVKIGKRINIPRSSSLAGIEKTSLGKKKEVHIDLDKLTQVSHRGSKLESLPTQSFSSFRRNRRALRLRVAA